MDRYEFLDSIHLGMAVTRDLFVRIYGFDLSFPGFRDLALNALNQIGYPNPWREYARIVTQYENQQNAMLKRVAESTKQRGGMADG